MVSEWTWEQVRILLKEEQQVERRRLLDTKGIKKRQKRRKKKTENCPLHNWVRGGSDLC